MLDLDHRDDLPTASAMVIEQRKQVTKTQRRLPVVEGGASRTDAGNPLPASEGRKLVPGEVLGEPSHVVESIDAFGRAALRELRMICDIGRRRQFVLVADDEDPVVRDDDVGFHGIHAHLDRQLIGAARVFGAVAGRTAVADDEGPAHALRLVVHSGFTAVAGHTSAPIRYP